MEIKTKRLRLVPLDAAQMELFCLGQEKLDDAMKLAESKTVRDEHLDEAYAQMREACAQNPRTYFWYTNWQIILKEENRSIGSLCFMGEPDADGNTELGYGIDEPYRGKGYASEAVKAVSEWAFAKGAYYVSAQTQADNDASKRVLEKCGFKPAGVGEEGLLFELERPASANIAIFMCLGLSVGLCFGLCFDNMALGMCFGVAIGTALGAALDAQDRKKRENRKK